MDYMRSFHVIWSQVEAFAYPAEQWQPGETIIQQVKVPVPAGAPPGDYRLRIGLFDQGSGERAPRQDEVGNYAGDAVLINGVPILAGSVLDELPAPPFAINDPAAPNLELLGYERGPHQVFTGESWGMALWWLASGKLAPLTINLELVDTSASKHLLLQTRPVYGSYPFAEWQPPQFVIARQLLAIPAEFLPGEYRLNVRLIDENEETVYTADLGPLQVEATERIFSPPPGPPPAPCPPIGAPPKPPIAPMAPAGPAAAAVPPRPAAAPGPTESAPTGGCSGAGGPPPLPPAPPSKSGRTA